MTDILIILFTVHLFGDFYLQPQNLPEKMIFKYRFVLLHSFVYAVSSLLFFIFQPTSFVLLLALSYAVFHLFINSFTHVVLKYKRLSLYKLEKLSYCVNQILHIGSLLILAVWFGDRINSSWIDCWLLQYNLTTPGVFHMLLLFMLIFKPANVTFRILFNNLKPDNDVSKSEENLRTGAIIGNMERLLITLLMLLGQYTAIGLVITGKSIARYKKISDEKSFAEYYLIGTFYSLIVVIFSFLIFSYISNFR